MIAAFYKKREHRLRLNIFVISSQLNNQNRKMGTSEERVPGWGDMRCTHFINGVFLKTALRVSRAYFLFDSAGAEAK